MHRGRKVDGVVSYDPDSDNSDSDDSDDSDSGDDPFTGAEDKPASFEDGDTPEPTRVWTCSARPTPPLRNCIHTPAARIFF